MHIDKNHRWVPDKTHPLNNPKLVDRVGLVSSLKIRDFQGAQED